LPRTDIVDFLDLYLLSSHNIPLSTYICQNINQPIFTHLKKLEKYYIDPSGFIMKIKKDIYNYLQKQGQKNHGSG